jgi:aryl-alcohol dehydrogenase-like predicted oxidoreductase
VAQSDANAGCFGLVAATLAELAADPGTSSVAHLRENLAGASLALTGEDLAVLDRTAR